MRDQIMWVYGSGFPKSHNMAPAIDKHLGAMGHRGKAFNTAGLDAGFTRPGGDMEAHRAVTPEGQQWQGWGTALKPAHEPIVVARKPSPGTVAANVLAHGTGALNIDGCRVPFASAADRETMASAKWHVNPSAVRPDSPGFMSSNKVGDILDGAQFLNELGRWPANLIHDGSEEVVGMFPGDDGASAARFFYSAKASKRDRDEGLDGFRVISAGEAAGGRKEGSAGLATAYAGIRTPRFNIHPTVKPTDLMRYLCRLVTPPGGLVLDPFTGSGSTGKGAVLEGFRFLGIELSPEYADIARARIGHAVGHVAPEPVIEVKVPDALRGQLRLFA
jgi:site-specific DNA-methyltransferase (adenine-specific)